MNRQLIILVLAAILLISCKSYQYRISSMNGTVVEMNSRFDANPNKKWKPWYATTKPSSIVR